MPYEAVVIGVSTGGFQALRSILPSLPANFPVPIAIVQHIAEQAGSYVSEHLDKISKITVKEAEDKEPLRPSHAYLAPAGYHALIEEDKTFSLSVDEKVNFSCPSIDVLFESAADAYQKKLIGVILTGANHDGAAGLRKIKQYGGLAVVQDPDDANAPIMPKAALSTTDADYTVTIKELPSLLIQLTKEK